MALTQAKYTSRAHKRSDYEGLNKSFIALPQSVELK